jgi:ubiquinone/menaquinone biosynthesis C-methylase UbiE
LPDIYEQDFYHPDEFLRESLTWQVEHQLKDILPQGRILDVGCGIGEFLKICKDRGYETHGIDISEWAVDACNRAELNVKAGQFPNLEYPQNYFHCVTMWDVIEHLTDPHAYLQSVWEVLKPEGWLIVKTPNVSSAVFGLAAIMQKLRSSTRTIEAILGLPAHILYFDLSSLMALVRSTGFIPQSVMSLGRMRSKPTARTVKGSIYHSVLDGLTAVGLAGNLLIYAQKPDV